MGWLLAGTLIVLSGGLHVDGLADSADGLFGGETREERLRIMHEGSIGAFGAAAVLLSLALKATAIASLTSLRPETLVLAPVIGRWSMNTAIAAYPYARPQGLGKAFHATALPWPALLATTITAVAVLVLLGPRGLVPAAIAAALALGLGRFMKERLGGLTGDTYGAIVEVAEVVFLLLVLALTADGWLA
jgi:adenosylcobinamide-GDP ribazoletransferase